MPQVNFLGSCQVSPWPVKLSQLLCDEQVGGYLGGTGDTNVQGEHVQKLDTYANNALLHCLGNRGNVGILASEENEEPVVVLKDPSHGKYIVVFDPLDGSSNIDTNISTGTIFSVLRRDPASKIPLAMCCSRA